MIIKAPKFVKQTFKKIHVDRSFQRKVCWTDETARKFILSVNKGRTPYPIVVADVETGIEQSIDSLNEVSENYYNNVKSNGCSMISLDGLQRSNALKRFFTDDLSITGEFFDADGMSLDINNKFFSSLPQRLQDKFNDYNVEIKVMEDLLYDELKENFININDGDPLNDQEKRNAYPTSISKYIRELSESNITNQIWIKITGMRQNVINRSLDAELLLKAFMATHPDKNYSPSKKNMDSFYELGVGKYSVSEYRSDVRSRFNCIMATVRDLCSKQTKHVGKGKIPQRQWWASVFLAARVYDENLQIDDYAEAYNEVYIIEKDLIAESKSKQGKDHDLYKKSLSTSNPISEPSDSDYYWHWASEPLKSGERSKRLNKLFSQSFKHISEKDLVPNAAK
tara:strand:- start:923 stop:2110 length:1188 start_codon:yes stop_codon:yes gene_type:complete